MDEPDTPTPAQVEAIYGRSTVLRAQLCVGVDESYARALVVARYWFEEGFARLGGAFHQAALTFKPADLDVKARLAGRRPGAIHVRLLVKQREDDKDADYVTYTPEAFADMLLALGRVPWLASLDCAANDAAGEPEGPWIDLIASRYDSGGTWLQLSVKGRGTFQAPALQAFLRDAAQQAHPLHGEISWGNDYMRCVYEEATHTGPAATLPNARRALRGYAWVTILPEEIGNRLGGVDGLRASDAFLEVEHLDAGGYWCRATETPEDFDQAVAERLFDAVAPALPPGRPDMWHVYPPNVLSPRDPAQR